MTPYRFHSASISLRHNSYLGSGSLTEVSFIQVTVVQGDAADEKTIQDLVSRTVKEEGHLDVFFANVSPRPTPAPRNPPHKSHTRFPSDSTSAPAPRTTLPTAAHAN